MTTKIVFGWLMSAALLSGPASAQETPTRMGGWVFSVFAGGAANSDLQRSEARAEWLTPGGLESRVFARRLTAETSGVVGLTTGYWFTPYWGLRAQAALAPSRLEIAVSQRETHDIPTDPMVTEPARYGPFRVWTFDGQLMVRVPVTPRNRVALYGFLGAGVVKYEAEDEEGLPPEAVQAFANGQSTAEPVAVFGLGAMVPLHREHLGFSFEISDHVARTPVRDPPGNLAVGARSVLVTTADETGPPRVRLINHVRILLGLAWQPN